MVARPTIMEPNFDSVLHPAQPGRSAELEIRLKVALLPRDPSKPGDPAGTIHHTHLASNMGEVRRGRVRDSAGFLYACRSWLVSEFNAYCIKFKRMVELSWNNQLILLPPDGSRPGDSMMSDAAYLEFVSRPDFAAHLRCSLDIQLIPVGRTKTHTVMEVVKLEKPAREQHASLNGFGSFAALICDEDVDFAPTKRSLVQVAAAHEVGHWLGRPVPLFSGGTINTDRMLHHIDLEACLAADPNYVPGSDCEYGNTLSEQMGLLSVGQLVTEYEARPWLNRARRHTKALFGWNFVHRIDFNNHAVPISDRQKRLIAGTASRKPAGQPARP
jgi:hypothetical protein